MHNIIDEEVQQLIDHLHLPEGQLLEMFTFTLSGNPLTEEEAKQFIRYLQLELSVQMDQRTH